MLLRIFILFEVIIFEICVRHIQTWIWSDDLPKILHVYEKKTEYAHVEHLPVSNAWILIRVTYISTVDLFITQFFITCV